MTVPGNPPHLTLVTNTEELRQRIADKIPKRRRGRPRKPAPASESEVALSEKAMIEARSKAYRDMEPYVCDLSHAATLAMEVSDLPELFLFAVNQLDDMVERFKANYYAQKFLLE
jgi:hypothetical protein